MLFFTRFAPLQPWIISIPESTAGSLLFSICTTLKPVSLIKKSPKMIDSCYRLREKADYDDFFLAAKEDAEHQLEKAKHVIHAVEQFIAEKR